NDPDVTWTDDHTALAEHLLGRRAAEVPYSQALKLGARLTRDLRDIEPDLNGPLQDIHRQTKTRAQLAAVIAAEVAALRAQPAAAKAIAEWEKAIESGPAAGVGYIPIMGAPSGAMKRPLDDVRATRAG